jgi:hypothetical protein
MRPLLPFVAAVLVSTSAARAPAAPPDLTDADVTAGWVALFDGESTFGWTVEGDAVVKDGKLIVGGEKATKLTTTAAFPAGLLRWKVEAGTGGRIVGPAGFVVADFTKPDDLTGERRRIGHSGNTGPITIEVPAGKQIAIAAIALSPGGLEPLFNGKDLSGWKVFKDDPAKDKATFTVTPAGELHVLGGPGDVQTERKFADFVLQTDVKTAGPTVNAGIFFRCVPGQFQNGYECQIQNGIKDGDRTKPLDFGTGAIYRRVPARKVVSSDKEWFTLTLIATGPHVATWVNGYQVVDWTDDRKPDENPRKGLRTEAGHISIQGHNPPMSADVLFRNLRIADLSATK